MLDLKDQRLLVIAPHPDDEIFGCGGLIYRIKQAGGEVFVLYLTVGTTKDYSKNGVSTSDERIEEIKRVAKFMGFDGWRIALPGNDYHLQLDHVPQKILANEIERGEVERGSTISLQAVKPTILAIPSYFDYNQDHRAANKAATTATRPVPPKYKHLPNTIIEYEFPYSEWSDVERPSPNLFIDLDKKALKAKLDALKLYKSQLKVQNGPLSLYGVETLARMRGLHSGNSAAEAFVIRRHFV
ncbi:MAG TPA: PIG-L family deacetylase [Candidatus Paceibacterota bacterium]|nr:PIG-L family deacetylase [Candidatus Paceibacterota bacterium]